MKSLIYIFIFSFNILFAQEVRIRRGDDVRVGGHVYRTVEIARVDSFYNVSWEGWFLDDMKWYLMPHLLDLETQKNQTGPGFFVNAFYDSIYFNPAAALKVCPAGWRLPRIGEWDTLINTLSDGQLKYMFNELPGFLGYSRNLIGDKINKDQQILPGGFWWSSTPHGEKVAGAEIDRLYRYNIGYGDQWDKASVRCIRKDE
jgi:uncharacterized protein (TIGR02145 family)